MPAGFDPFAEVPVAVGVLDAAARLLDLLAGFLAGADPAVRACLGRFVIAGRPDAGVTTAAFEAAIVVYELTEAADLLHGLAGDGGAGGEVGA
jgi:hypothetical protein